MKRRESLADLRRRTRRLERQVAAARFAYIATMGRRCGIAAATVNLKYPGMPFDVALGMITRVVRDAIARALHEFDETGVLDPNDGVDYALYAARDAILASLAVAAGRWDPEAAIAALMAPRKARDDA